MGTIVSPPNGANVYKGAILPISYRSDTVDFDCGVLSNICTVRYRLNGVNYTGFVPISQTGVAPQTQATQNVTMPLTGVSATVDAQGWGVGGQLNDTTTATYNLIDPPTANCDPATAVTDTTAQLNGTIAGTLIAGGSARFVWGTPAPLNNAATIYSVGAVNAALTGLTPNTTYQYRLEILDAFGNVVEVGPICNFTTDTAALVPSAACAAASGATQTDLTFNGTLTNVPVGGSARFRYGSVLGGPYGSTIAATPYADGPVTADATGLTANTTYYYILEILDNSNTVVATSAECNGLTLSNSGGTGTPVDVQIVKLCSITDVTLMKDCATGNPILLITVTSADGDVIPTASTEFLAAATGVGVFSTMGYYRSYYTDLNGAYLTPQPADPCVNSDSVTRQRIAGSETLAFNDVTSISLTVPTGANIAEISVEGGSVRFTTDGVDPDNTTKRGHRVPDGGWIELESADELTGFRLLGLAGQSGVIYVEYFYLSSLTNS